MGSLPGTDLRAALRLVHGELPEPLALPELPARGPWASMTARGLAVLTELAAELAPSGWRLTRSRGRDHERAVGTLRRDLDDLEELAHESGIGSAKLSLVGPWTLASTVELARGEAMLADPGAVRELHQALGAGLADLLGELCRRLPQVTWTVQLDEPMLPAVAQGKVATASRLNHHRRIDPDTLVSGLAAVRGAVDGPVALHCCAPGLDLAWLSRAGIDRVAVDTGTLGDLDPFAEWVESGREVWWGVLPTWPVPSRARSWDVLAFERYASVVRAMGIDPRRAAAQGVLTPACGLATWQASDVPAALRAVAAAATRADDVEA